MIKTELFIGAWVLYGGTHAKIDGIAKGGFSIHLSKGQWVPLSDVSPIALTPEILEKNGFEIVEPLYPERGCIDFVLRYKCLYSIELYLYKRENENTYMILTQITCANRNEGGLNKMTNCDIENIHQLQQAMRICGIEKEIEL